jgi:glycosyltransferase involved in cell wall biosynthesis
MHIIVLENEPSSSRGGQELSLLDVCRGLFQRGHSITLLYVKEGDLLKQYQAFCTQIVNVNGYKINGSRPVTYLSFFTDIWKVAKIKNSVVYINEYRDSFFGCALASFKNIPLVCHLRLPPLKDTLSIQQIIGLRGVKQFIAISNQTKSDWVNKGFRKETIDVVYNGINLELFKPLEEISIKGELNISKDTKVILYVGRLNKEKGLETLINAFALLLKSGINARLLIAGKPLWNLNPERGEEYRKLLKQLSIDLGIEKHVNFLGHVTNTTTLYQMSNVTVLPSLWAEPFGRVVIESMACGTPVVASRTGGIPEILTGEFQSGLFEPGNAQNLSATLNFVMNWQDKSPDLSEKCRKHVLEKFGLDRMVEGVEKVFLKLVKCE